MNDIERLEDKIDGLVSALRKTADPSTSSIIFKMQVENKAFNDRVLQMFDNFTKSLETIDNRLYLLESWVSTRKIELSKEIGVREGSVKTGYIGWRVIASVSGFFAVTYYLVVDVIDRMHR